LAPSRRSRTADALDHAEPLGDAAERVTAAGEIAAAATDVAEGVGDTKPLLDRPGGGVDAFLFPAGPLPCHANKIR
jgi:hypothetical protein